MHKRCTVCHRFVATTDCCEGDFETRFWSTVEKTDSGCWLWTSHLDRDGYSRTSVGGVSKLAHRVSYELIKGTIGEGLDIDHLCRTRACVNPDHLEPVTRAENNRRKAAHLALVPRGVHARPPITHCINGHEWTEANTYVARGSRTCRDCNRDAARRYAARKAAGGAA